MNKPFVFTIILMTLLGTLSANSAPSAKKNFCSITLNSTEEITLFKSHLSANDWNFVELVPPESEVGDKNWFSNVCKAEIKCDVLVVSGHFGGTFFGNSKFRLSTKDLEAQSCEAKCDGILNQPKEVFLFGCNTLASKEKDQRSPEEYMRVLLADGFTYQQASQIVSFRYSGFGDSFKSKMSQIFPKTEKIYGFKSIGPSGKTVKPYLDNYLTAAKSDYANFDAYTKQTGINKNGKFLNAMKKTSVEQTSGAILNMKSVEEKPYCYIRSDKIERLKKLEYVKTLFSTGKALQILNHIQDFLHDVKESAIPMTVAERKVFTDMAQDEKLKNELLSLLQLKGDIYVPLKVNVLFTLRELGLVTEQYMAFAFNGTVDLKTPFTVARKDMLCSSDFTMDIPPELIPAERWTEMNFVVALMCLKPKNVEILTQMAKVVENAQDPVLRGSAAWFFYTAKPKDIGIQKILAKALAEDLDKNVRHSLAMIFREIRPTSWEVISMLETAGQKETDGIVSDQIKQMLVSIKK